MRVALLAPPAGAHAAGTVVDPEPQAAVESLLRRRGFTPGLTRVPAMLAALARGGFDVAHAFDPVAALAALRWGRAPVVFTCTEVLTRATLADRRVRLLAFRRALEESDVLLAATPAVRDALDRWCALSPPVLDPADGAVHLRLYGDLHD